MRAQAYVLEVICENVDAEVRLNDWIAYHATDARRRVAQQKLNPWLLEGDNRLTVTLAPLDRALMFRMSLYKTEHGTRCTDDKALVVYHWTPEEAPLERADPEAVERPRTFVFEHAFRMSQAFGLWSWEQGQAYMPSDRPHVVGLVERLHRALEARQVDEVMAMLSTKLEEMARAVGLPIDDYLRAQRELMEQQLHASDLLVGPLDTDALVLRSSAGGRLVDIFDENGRPAPLKMWVGEMPAHLSLAASHVSGAWRIVR